MHPIKIVLHHSLTEDGKTVSWGSIRKFHMTDPAYRFTDIGYHAGVELVGDHYEIFMGRMWDHPGAHCQGLNHSSLGLCVVGNFDAAPPPLAQWELAVKMCALWCKLYSIKPSDIEGHNRFSQKSCPGRAFDIIKFREDVKKYLGAT